MTSTDAFAFYHLPAIVESRARLKSGGIVFRFPDNGIGQEGGFTIKGDVLTVTVAKDSVAQIP